MKFVNKKHLIIILLVLWMIPRATYAQYAWQDGAEPGNLDLGHDIRYNIELQGSFSHGTMA